MKKQIYSYRDKKLGAYGDPILTTDAPDVMTEAVARSCVKVPDDKKAEAADKALYHFGYFDDVDGKFFLLDSPDKLLDLEDYILKGINDGK